MMCLRDLLGTPGQNSVTKLMESKIIFLPQIAAKSSLSEFLVLIIYI